MNENEFKISVKINTAAFLIATAGTLFLPQMLNLKENTLGFTNSIFAVFVWLLCMFAVNLSLRTIDLRDTRGWKIAAVFSFLFAAAMLFGVRLDAVGSVNFKDWRLWIALVVFTCLFTVLTRKLWHFLDGIGEKKKRLSEHIRIPSTPTTAAKYADILTFVFLLLCWLPVLLAVYPGFFVYDAQDEWVQVASRTFNTHHPLVHVLLLGGIVCAVHKVTDSYNLGIACYIIIQMMIVSGGFTYLLFYMRKRKVSKVIRILSLLYFAFFPVIVMFTLCSAKDALFTVALLLLLLALLDMGSDAEIFFASKRKIVFFVLSAVAMMLFRKNGVYAFVFMVPILLIYHKKYFKKTALLLAVVFLSYFLTNIGLTAALHAESGENQEILTVPIQQLARTYKFNREVFEPEDIETLHEILPEEALDLYRPKLSDPVKVYFQNDAFEKDQSKYIGLWLRIGLKKPMSYINAWLANSYGFWYPDTVIDVYSGNRVFTFTYKNSSYFGYEVEEPGYRDSKIPWLDEVYRKLSLEISQEKIPLFSMLFSPGAMFWAIAFVFAYVLYRKRYHLVIPCLMVLLVWLTVLLGPTYLPRYVLIFWFGMPLFAAMLGEEI